MSFKIGLIKETKNPVDNRVALTPAQAAGLKERFENLDIIVEPSDIRAFSDSEYEERGVTLSQDLSDCDILFGIKEADIKTLIPEKHYIFFGHIAKQQPYNKPLFRELIEKHITFSDYEYLVDDTGHRVAAFGWFAGVVGLYYTLQGWGRKYSIFDLPKPDANFTVEKIIQLIKKEVKGNIKIVITGNGRVSQGAQYVLKKVGAKQLTIADFTTLKDATDTLTYCLATLEDLVVPKEDSNSFEREEFNKNPSNYSSSFQRFENSADILLSCHFWKKGQPVYLKEEDFLRPSFRIRMIGDITCDIKGSIKSTLRSSTHAEPFYDYNPNSRKEEKAFSSAENVSVMAVDTCPNALPRVASEYFGERLIETIINPLLGDRSQTVILDRSTILEKGKLTPAFQYLSDYVSTLQQKSEN